MLLHLLWGGILWFSISKYGLGVSTDSVELLFSGYNLSQGRGLISYDGGFAILWPPLYSTLLGLVHRIFSVDMLAAAALVQVGAFIGLAWCLTQLFLKIFREDFLLAMAANVLADVGAVVLIGFGMVGTDYLHVFLAMLVVLLTALYVETGSPRTYVLLAVAGMLATLVRYLGIAALTTAAISVMWLRGGSLRQRLARGSGLALTVIPAGMWLAITSQLYSRRGPISFTENFTWFSRSVLEWFFVPQVLKADLELYIAGLWLIVLAMVILAARALYRPQASTSAMRGEGASLVDAPRSAIVTVLLFGLLYALALFGSASIAYFNKLGGRFLLPLYVPFVTLFVVAVDQLKRKGASSSAGAIRALGAIGGYGVLVVATLLLLRVTLPLAIESQANGATGGENEFNTKAWRENAAMLYWLSHEPAGNYRLMSDQPDGVAFSTWHAVDAVPRKTTGPYGTEAFPLSSYAADLFSGGPDVYILWIDPNPYPYNYSVQEIGSIAEVEPLYAGPEGGAYRLRPKPGP